jgi:hypothetical protein
MFSTRHWIGTEALIGCWTDWDGTCLHFAPNGKLTLEEEHEVLREGSWASARTDWLWITEDDDKYMIWYDVQNGILIMREGDSNVYITLYKCEEPPDTFEIAIKIISDDPVVTVKDLMSLHQMYSAATRIQTTVLEVIVNTGDVSRIRMWSEMIRIIRDEWITIFQRDFQHLTTFVNVWDIDKMFHDYYTDTILLVIRAATQGDLFGAFIAIQEGRQDYVMLTANIANAMHVISEHLSGGGT